MSNRARIKYSLQWPRLRKLAWINSIDSFVSDGNSDDDNGWSHDDVFEPEKRSVENKKITPIQVTAGHQFPKITMGRYCTGLCRDQFRLALGWNVSA